MSSQPAVSVDGLTLSYGNEVAVDGVTFSIPTGRLVGVVGPNGAGKSTLIKALVGAKKPDAGTVSLFGEPAENARERLTYVPQQGDVDWDFPITAGQVIRQGRYRSTGLLGWFSDEDRRAVRRAMEAVDVADLADRQIGELSGGQKQRVFLARALAEGGDLYVMDEPFAGVDASTESAIVEVLQRLGQEGNTVVVVHHDLMTVREYFDHLVLLNGELITCGPIEQAFTAENLRAAYGGQIALVSHAEATDGSIAGAPES